MFSKQRKSQSPAFTLIEVLVASGISLMLMIVLVNVFNQTSISLDHASGRIDLVRKSRYPVERMSRYLTSAVGIPGEDSVLYPPLLNPTNSRGQAVDARNPDTWDRVLVFRTTEDFFATTATVGYDFDPDGILDVNDIKNNLEIWERDDQRLTEYVIWYEDDTFIDWLPDAKNCIAIARLNDTVVSAERTEAWVENWLTQARPQDTFQAGIEPRILVHDVKDLGFRMRVASGIQTSVAVDGEIRQAQDRVTKTFRFDGFIQIPTERFNNN